MSSNSDSSQPVTHSTSSTILGDFLDKSYKHDLARLTAPQPPRYNDILSKTTHNRYRLTSRKLGDGSWCTVKKCIRTDDNKKFAVKIINLSKISRKDAARCRQEIKILSQLDSEYVVDFEASYITKEYMFIIMELCRYGTLFDYLQAYGMVIGNRYVYQCEEYEIGYLFYQLVCGIHYCHKQNIVHRDLKLENILIKKVSKNNIKICIIDFGLSKKNTKKMYTKCGSPEYIPPEFIQGSKYYKKNGVYTAKCDWWSAGVMLYALLSGRYPFSGENRSILYRRIANVKYSFHNRHWNNISVEAQDLVSKLLVGNPKDRYSYNEIMSHPFMKTIKTLYT